MSKNLFSFLVPQNCAGGLPQLNHVGEPERTETGRARVVFAHSSSAPACGLKPPSGWLPVAPAFAMNEDRTYNLFILNVTCPSVPIETHKRPQLHT